MIRISRWGDLVCAVLLVTGFFWCYSNSREATSVDTYWSVPVAVSLIREGNVNLDEFLGVHGEKTNYAIKYLGDHAYNFFPIGVSLAAVPFVYAYERAPEFFISYVPGFEKFQPEQLKRKRVKPPGAMRVKRQLERLTASVVTALAVGGVLYFVARSYLNWPLALLATIVFGLGTSAWSILSRGLWQHGPLMLAISSALLLMVKAKENPKLLQYVSIPLACAYVIRPTSSVFIVCISLFVLSTSRAVFLRYVGWGLPVAVAFGVGNWSLYQSILPPYYSPERLGMNPEFWSAFFANLISPSRGLFVFSPVLLFLVLGVYEKWRHRLLDRFDLTLLCCCLLHLLAIASVPTWWAGHSYGPRFTSDLLPFLFYYLIWGLRFVSSSLLFPRLIGSTLFFILASLSIMIHARGAISFSRWNKHPISVDLQPDRVWDWNDPQFLRGNRLLKKTIRRIANPFR